MSADDKDEEKKDERGLDLSSLLGGLMGGTQGGGQESPAMPTGGWVPSSTAQRVAAAAARLTAMVAWTRAALGRVSGRWVACSAPSWAAA